MYLVYMDRLIGLVVSVPITHEIAGSILDTPTILNVNKVWIGVHQASWGQLGSYLIEK